MTIIRTVLTSLAAMAILATPLDMTPQSHISDTTVVLDTKNTAATLKKTHDAIDSLEKRITTGAKNLRDKSASIKVIEKSTAEEATDSEEFEVCETESIRDIDSGYGNFFDNDDVDSIEGVLAIILIFACVTPLGIALIALVIVMLFMRGDRVRRSRLIEMSLKTGQPLPPEFYRRPRPRVRLQSGLMWIAWGLGLMVFFYFGSSSSRLAAMMFIPTFIGVAKILTYYLIDRRAEIRDTNADKD